MCKMYVIVLKMEDITKLKVMDKSLQPASCKLLVSICMQHRNRGGSDSRVQSKMGEFMNLFS